MPLHEFVLLMGAAVGGDMGTFFSDYSQAFFAPNKMVHRQILLQCKSKMRLKNFFVILVHINRSVGHCIVYA